VSSDCIEDDLGEPSWAARLLALSRHHDTFVARNPRSIPGMPLFGGLIAAQALAAAGTTVAADMLPQSLHAYFVRGGRVGVDVDLSVERTRDGRSFDTRRVTASQRGDAILELIASFHRPEAGADWYPARAPAVEFDDAIPKVTGLELTEAFEFRTAPADSSPLAIPPFWIRAKEEVEDSPLLRSCVLTLMSDFGPVPVARPPGVPVRPGSAQTAVPDHSVWFHRPFVPHHWHRYEVAAQNHSDSRGLVNGSLYDAAGRLIASTAQEALWRPLPKLRLGSVGG